MNKQELLNGLNWIRGTYPNEGGFNSGVGTGLGIAIIEIDKLDEPEQLVVPKFAADWYEENEDDLEFEIFNLVTTLSEKGYDELTDLEAWFNNFENGPIETFMRMKLFGYKVEKEKLYYVLDKNNHTMLYRSFDYSITQAKSKYAVDPTIKNFNLNEYELTEQEIRNYDARFMAFAVEAAE